MLEREMCVTLSPGAVEMLLCRKLAGQNGTVLSDRKAVQKQNGMCTALVFSRFYKRFASIYAMTVMIEAQDGFTKVTWGAASGRKDLPLVGDFGAGDSFCKEIQSALEKYRI